MCQIKGGKLSMCTEDLLKLYNSQNKLENPPSYLEDLKTILKLDGLLGDET